MDLILSHLLDSLYLHPSAEIFGEQAELEFGKGKMYVWFNGVTPTKENKTIKQRDTVS